MGQRCLLGAAGQTLQGPGNVSPSPSSGAQPPPSQPQQKALRAWRSQYHNPRLGCPSGFPTRRVAVPGAHGAVRDCTRCSWLSDLADLSRAGFFRLAVT